MRRAEQGDRKKVERKDIETFDCNPCGRHAQYVRGFNDSGH